MNRKWIDLVVVAVATLVALAMSQVSSLNVVARAILVTPLVLCWPGYALTAVLFPSGSLRLSERLLLTCALSLAVTCVGGFVLNSTSSGMEPTTWVVWLGAMTLGTTLLAAARRLHSDATPRPLGWQISRRSAALMAASLVIIGGAYGISRAAAARQQATNFTQLWMVPQVDGNDATVNLGVHNVEGQAMNYRLALTVKGTVVHEWSQIALNPEQTWASSFTLPETVAASDDLEAVLYRLDTPQTPYRRVVVRGDEAKK